MIILDTDILTLHQRAESAEYSNLKARLDAVPDQTIWATMVSFEEQTRGWLALLARARSREQLVRGYERLRAHLKDFCERPTIDFDHQAAEVYGQLTKTRIRIGTMDLRIAAIALAHNATLLSRNLADFRKVPGLRVEDWTTPVR